VRRALVLSLLAIAALETACTPPHPALRECDAMPVKGWQELLAKEPFAALANSKDMPYESIYGTSRMFLADSNYNYDQLLTITFLHPAMAQGRPDERCIRDVSLLVHEPVEGARASTLAALVAFLQANGLTADLARAIDAAREQKANFAPLGSLGAGAVSAGFVEQGARGRFFEVEVRSPVAPEAPK